ncbi:MAG: hypothetical protein ACKOAV_05205, partial [Bacteroidota bacterium]
MQSIRLKFFLAPVMALAFLLVGIPRQSWASMPNGGEGIGEVDANAKLIRQVFDSALVSGRAYPLLRDLCKKAGHRLSGSEGAERAVLLMRDYLQGLGLDCVWLQPLMVPRWVRGAAEQGQVLTGDAEPYRL